MDIEGETINNGRESRITLNVGGARFVTTLETIQNYPDTMLGRMFAQENKELTRPNEKGEYHIDFSPQWFDHILRFYRTGKPVPRPLDIDPSFEEALDFWAIPTATVIEQLNVEASEILREFLDGVIEVMFSAVKSFVPNIQIVFDSLCHVRFEPNLLTIHESVMFRFRNGYKILNSSARMIVSAQLRKILSPASLSIVYTYGSPERFHLSIENYLNFDTISQHLTAELEYKSF
ncbi:POZ domain-containing protein [Basidiobolus meristosporus CBS 931.73]|uniref:POZ domain-containing protein n=1 Tax=Basidiobolus meristosporus CBS 931.73 TaxID=1314790 RepID=A0A1Y1Y289_9FUNG|nr:POZ domain-containing protein [Basidiobolus meristosporus CBS 931.73]|eukprot:ORX92098.1 POZ domain-containing protein [Basidiobolus meristosporus CBS 931.73]